MGIMQSICKKCFKQADDVIDELASELENLKETVIDNIESFENNMSDLLDDQTKKLKNILMTQEIGAIQHVLGKFRTSCLVSANLQFRYLR